MIIGLCGYAGSGKDEFASFLIKRFARDNLQNAYRVAFADKVKENLKQFLVDEFSINIETCGREDKEVLRPILVAYAEAKRAIDSEFWISAAMPKIKKHIDCGESVVITDVRYINEARFLKEELNSIIVYIGRKSISAANVSELKSVSEVIPIADFEIIFDDYDSEAEMFSAFDKFANKILGVDTLNFLEDVEDDVIISSIKDHLNASEDSGQNLSVSSNRQIEQLVNVLTSRHSGACYEGIRSGKKDVSACADFFSKMGNTIVYSAAIKFDPEKGSSFPSFLRKFSTWEALKDSRKVYMSDDSENTFCNIEEISEIEHQSLIEKPKCYEEFSCLDLLSTLPEKDADIVKMSIIDGYSLKEIAEKYDCSHEHVRNVKDSALEKLRKLI